NPGALTKFDIGWEQITATLNSANANRPKGSVEDADHSWLVRSTDQLFTAAEYAPLIVAYRNNGARPPLRHRNSNRLPRKSPEHGPGQRQARYPDQSDEAAIGEHYRDRR